MKIKLPQNRLLTGGLMLMLGMAAAGVSNLYQPVAEEITGTMVMETAAETTAADIPSETDKKEVEETAAVLEEVFVPHVEQLNLAYYYPEDADESEPLNSKAGRIFKELMAKDEAWMSEIYDLSDVLPSQMAARLGQLPDTVMGHYDPEDERHDPQDSRTWTINSFKQVHITFKDGDDKICAGYSNVIPIMSMASVYTWFHDLEDDTAFRDYAMAAWNKSHRYTASIGAVYECSGCIGENSDALELEELLAEDTDETSAVSSDNESEPEEAAILETAVEIAGTARARNPGPGVLAATPSEVIESSAFEDNQTVSEEPPEVTSCPGHVDLYITARMIGINEKNGLFDIDIIGGEANQQTDGRWEGWNTDTKSYAARLSRQDWYETYGLSVSALSFNRNPLAESEIEAMMERLPGNLSNERRKLVHFALSSVGRVPYYWGGKANNSNYAGNDFGTVIAPDQDGRMLKGLDCSGWINWVYWSATGSRLPYESTSGLVTCGRRIQRHELEPGDIVLRTGTNAHVIMFLGWSEDGQILCVQETTGGVNNVTISERDANWPYYRRIVE